MFCSNISLFICMFVAVVSATNYGDPESLTGTDPGVTVRRLRRDNLGTSTVGADEELKGAAGAAAEHLGTAPGTSVPRPAASRTSPTSQPHSEDATAAAATPTAAPCLAHTTNDTAVSLLRNLPAEERNRRLIDAAKEGDVEEMQVLLAAGADVQARSEDEFTALLWAADRGHVEAVRCLLARGADMGARNMEEDTPLHLAAWSGHAPVVRLLAAASADLNARSDRGRTPLHWAAYQGHAEAAAALLEAGADTAATDAGGQTPLDVARQYNHHQLVDLLG